MVAGSVRPLIDAFRIAHVELIEWLAADYGFDRLEAYQVVSQGFCKTYERDVRAVLQGSYFNLPVPSINFPSELLNFAIYTTASMTVPSSGEVHGNVGSNGDVTVINNSTAIFGDVSAAGTVDLNKNNSGVSGFVHYGVALTGRGRNNVGGSRRDATTITIPTIDTGPNNPYLAWANTYGANAFTESTSLSSQPTTPILYVNADKTANYTLSINSNIQGPLTILVNGSVSLGGNTVLGTQANPVAIVCTGGVSCQGTPQIHGIIWSQGQMGGGTPDIYGSVICDNPGGNGTPAWYHRTYNNINLVPPSSSMFGRSCMRAPIAWAKAIGPPSISSCERLTVKTSSTWLSWSSVTPRAMHAARKSSAIFRAAGGILAGLMLTRR
jgi:hypothetical protein